MSGVPRLGLFADPSGARFVHFSTDLPPEFYLQLTAEARVPQRTAGGESYRWMKRKGARNKVLDCTVYAIFCTHQLGLHLYTEKMWERLEFVVQPPNGDLFSVGRRAEPMPAAAPVAAPGPAPAPPHSAFLFCFR